MAKERPRIPSILMAPILFTFSLSILPSMGAAGLHAGLIIDTVEKYNAAPASKPVNYTETYSFFNLTNAYEMQTQVPVPKPILCKIPRAQA